MQIKKVSVLEVIEMAKGHVENKQDRLRYIYIGREIVFGH